MTTPLTEKAIGRMRKVLLQAEAAAASSPHEADNARALLFEMLAKYDVSEEYIQAIADAPDDAKEERVFEIRKPFIQKGRLMHVLSQTCHVRVVMGSKPKTTVQKVHAFGFKSDMNTFSMLWNSILTQGERSYALEQIPPGVHPPTFKRRWWETFTVAIFQQLTNEKVKAHSTATPGAELVLKERDKDVEDFLREQMGKTRKGKKSATRGGPGHREGYAAGKRVDLSNSGVGGSAQRGALE